MALSYSTLGYADRPDVLDDTTSLRPDLRCVVADVTIGTTSSDYVSSLGGVALVASSFGLNTILFADGALRASSATLKSTILPVWDANLKGMKFVYRSGPGSDGTGAALMHEVLASDLAAGDILRVCLLGV